MSARKTLKRRSKIFNPSVNVKSESLQKPQNDNLEAKKVLPLSTPQSNTEIKSTTTTEPLKPKIVDGPDSKNQVLREKRVTDIEKRRAARIERLKNRAKK